MKVLAQFSVFVLVFHCSLSAVTEVRTNEEDKHPCADLFCGIGQNCVLDEQKEPKCVCIEQCPEELDERRRVCSNYNVTWSSDCEVNRMRCFCEQNDTRCSDETYKHVHIDYYGTCRDILDCTDDQMQDFPRRMKEWLFNIMEDLSESNQLENGYKPMLDEAKTDSSYKLVNPVIWKFCDLDLDPSDREVSRHELFPIRAPMVSMEHCMARFLDSCDANDDHKVSLNEWGKCLGVENEHITDRCINK